MGKGEEEEVGIGTTLRNITAKGSKEKTQPWEEDIDQGRFLGIMVLLGNC